MKSSEKIRLLIQNDKSRPKGPKYSISFPPYVSLLKVHKP